MIVQADPDLLINLGPGNYRKVKVETAPTPSEGTAHDFPVVVRAYPADPGNEVEDLRSFELPEEARAWLVALRIAWNGEVQPLVQ